MDLSFHQEAFPILSLRQNAHACSPVLTRAHTYAHMYPHVDHVVQAVFVAHFPWFTSHR